MAIIGWYNHVESNHWLIRACASPKDFPELNEKRNKGQPNKL